MKIREFYVLSGDIYKVSIYTEDWSQRDKQLMGKYGEPEVQVGGAFTGPPAFTLSTELLHVMSEAPFEQSFDARDYPTHAESMANVWADAISNRIQAEITVLRANDDDYTREEVINV